MLFFYAREPLSEQELEEKFTILTMALTIDISSINRRLEKQKNRLQYTEANLAKVIGMLKDTVSQEKGSEFIGAQVDELIRACSLVSASAERYGAIREEKKILRCVGLIHNYVAVLRKRLSSFQCLSTE